MSINRKTILLTVAAFATMAVAIVSCQHDPYMLPVAQRTGDPSICFERDVLPIFISNCSRSGCHGSGRGAGGYQLDDYQHITAKGIVPGNPAASIIWQSISMHNGNVKHMPEDAPDLSAVQLDVINRWIKTGAIDSGACASTYCDSATYTYSGAIAPMMQLYCTGCHSSASSSGGSLADYASVREAAVNGRMMGDITHANGYNAMPQGGIKLSDCQIAQVRLWVAAGAPNN